MITGKTSTGFEFSVDDNVMNDMELFEEIVDVDKGNIMAVASVCNRILGNQKAALYEFLRGVDGRVPMDAVLNTVMEIFNICKDGKKS